MAVVPGEGDPSGADEVGVDDPQPMGSRRLLSRRFPYSVNGQCKRSSSSPKRLVPVKHEPGTEVVFFSPAEELRKTDEVMMKNMQAMQAGQDH